MTGDGYILSRGYHASVRLNTQHHLWDQMFGYLLHPAIPTSKPDGSGLAIADVGAGTGIWLLELDRQLPGKASELVGLDVSSQQYPRSALSARLLRRQLVHGLGRAGPPDGPRRRVCRPQREGGGREAGGDVGRAVLSEHRGKEAAVVGRRMANVVAVNPISLPEAVDRACGMLFPVMPLACRWTGGTVELSGHSEHFQGMEERLLVIVFALY